MSRNAVARGSIDTSVPLVLLACAGFLSVAGARVIDPLLSVVAADFRTSISSVAIVVAAFTLAYGCAQLVIGPLGDRFGKLKVIVAALVAYAVMNTGCALVTNLSQLTVLRVGAGASSAALVPLCLALIADNSAYAERQLAISRFLLGVAMAQVIAGPLGGAFGEFISWRGVFLLLAALAIATAAPLALHVRQRPPLHSRAAPRPDPSLLLQTGPLQLLLATLVEGALFGGTLPFIAPYLHDTFGLSFLAVGLVVACFGVGIVCYRTSLARMLPILGERGSMLAGTLIAAVALIVGTDCVSWGVFIPVEVLLGFGYFTVHTVLQTRATDMLPGSSGTATSAFAFVLFMGQALGVVLAGKGIAAFGYRPTFRLVSLLMLGLGLALSLLSQRSAVAHASGTAPLPPA